MSDYLEGAEDEAAKYVGPELGWKQAIEHGMRVFSKLDPSLIPHLRSRQPSTNTMDLRAYGEAWARDYAKKLVELGKARPSGRSVNKGGIHRYPVGLSLRPSPNEKDNWQDAANDADLTLSEWARRVLNRAAVR